MEVVKWEKNSHIKLLLKIYVFMKFSAALNGLKFILLEVLNPFLICFRYFNVFYAKPKVLTN